MSVPKHLKTRDIKTGNGSKVRVTLRDASEVRADEYLQPIIDATDGEYGSKKRLAEEMSKRTGQVISRHVMERWLHPDPAKRQQPLLGSGLLLRETWEAVNKKTTTRKDTK